MSISPSREPLLNILAGEDYVSEEQTGSRDQCNREKRAGALVPVVIDSGLQTRFRILARTVRCLYAWPNYRCPFWIEPLQPCVWCFALLSQPRRSGLRVKHYETRKLARCRGPPWTEDCRPPDPGKWPRELLFTRRLLTVLQQNGAAAYTFPERPGRVSPASTRATRGNGETIFGVHVLAHNPTRCTWQRLTNRPPYTLTTEGPRNTLVLPRHRKRSRHTRSGTEGYGKADWTAAVRHGRRSTFSHERGASCALPAEW